MKNLRTSVGVTVLILTVLTTVNAQRARPTRSPAGVPANTLMRIISAEDHRRWDNDLASLLNDKDANVRRRAALAAGRIGDERAVPGLSDLLRDLNPEVRQMAAFALGEVESPAGADVLMARLEDRVEFDEVRARSVEALGKIGATLVSNTPAGAQGAPAKPEDPRLTKIKTAILDALKFEAERRSSPDRSTILFGLTAVLRTRPEGAGNVVVRFLGYSDPRIVADALNTMARLRLKDNNDQVRKLLTSHADPVVRANAARVLGAAEDKGAFDALLDHAVHDADARVRVSAIRSLASLKDARAVLPLTKRGAELFKLARLNDRTGARNEGLEILTALGTLSAGQTPSTTGEQAAARIELALRIRASSQENFPEDEIAQARTDPADYLEYLKGFESAAAQSSPGGLRRTFYGARSMSARAAGLAELSRIKPKPPEQIPTAAKLQLRAMLDDPRTPIAATPDVLRSYSLFKPDDLSEVSRRYLKHSDIIVRGTAADVLGGLPADETNARALIEALPIALRDKDLNDAVLSILDALAKEKTPAANEAIKSALTSSDQLVRKRAVALLKTNGAGDFSDRVGPAETRNTDVDYRRAIARIGKQVRATLITSKGQFTISFLPEEAPLTVDNFIQLARRGYFNGVTFHRVVPNFVVQGGDPRGDGNGGPGYSIRCEVNEVPYDRAALGMALSGKDTGGSQWFVTHSPQPHLDGGYTVFGRVISGMDVVDSMVRGDIIRRVVISER